MTLVVPKKVDPLTMTSIFILLKLTFIQKAKLQTNFEKPAKIQKIASEKISIWRT